MGERRKHKSLRNMEEETRHLSGMSEHNSWTGKDRESSHGSGRYHEFSEARTTIPQKSMDHSGWPSWESIEVNPTASVNDSFKNTHEGKERGGVKRCYNNVSPGFDGMELHSRYHTNEYNQSHSQRSGKDRESNHGSRRYNEFSEARTTIPQKSRDHSGWPSWESIEENPTALVNDSFKNTHEGKERSGGKRCYNNVSPGFDGMELHARYHTNEYDQSDSQRSGKDRESNHGSRRYNEFSESRTTVSHKSRDNSGWPSWESIEENPTAPVNDSFKNTREGKERGGGKRCYRNVSPGFDGMEHYQTNEYDQSRSQRYPRRGRSRSRSRTRGRSRSRSLTRGRERERRRGRSGSISDGNAKNHTKSRSPIGDYRLESYGWSDRRSGPEKSSQICRDLSTGRCKRGTQCRFFHPNSTSHRDGDLMEDDTTERWRSRADHSRIPKQSYSRGSGSVSRDDISDSYRGEDEQFLNRSRNATPCKNLTRGNCRWGDTCRFSHHAASDDSFGQKARNASFDKDIDRQPYKNSKPLCKFFAAGKCGKDNCRFSHEDPNLNNLEAVRGEVSDNRTSHDKINLWNGPTWDDPTRISDIRTSHDKINLWNGPTWDDATRISDTVEPTGWGETILTNTRITDHSVNGQNDDRGRRIVENENSNWGILEGTSVSLNSEKRSSLPGESGSYGGGTAPTESIAEDNMANKHENFILRGSQLQNQDGITNAHGQNELQENESFSIKALQQNIFPASNIQQEHGRVVENNQMNTFGSDVPAELKEIRYTTHPILLSGQSLSQNAGSIVTGSSLISNESDRGRNILCPSPSNGFNIDLNWPKTHIVGPLNEQTQMQSNLKAVQSPGLLEAKFSPLSTKLLTSEQTDQETPLTTAGHQVPPASSPVPDMSGCAPLVNTSIFQPNPDAVSRDLFHSVGNDRSSTEHSNLAQGTEQNNQTQLKISSPLPVAVTEVDRSKVKHPESQRLRQEEIVPNAEVMGDIKAMDEESKGVQENKHAELLDALGKVEEGSLNKDEKGMRVFKNALVDFVKDILKPTWKEGRMSRDVHKTIVKKVVDKVSFTIQADLVPKTQVQVEQYLSISKPNISKLVQAYVERCSKTDS